MAKRFTASEKWQDVWFRKLKPKYKLFWMYLLDACDNAGLWEKDFELASFIIGDTYKDDDCIKIFADKIIQVNGKWFIWKFIEFQYDHLNPAVNAHKSVIVKLNKYSLLDDNFTLKQSYLTVNEQLPNSSATDQDKDKDIDKDRNKDNIKIKYADFVFMTEKEYNNLITELGEQITKDKITDLNLWKGGKGKKTASDYLTILAWHRKDLKQPAAGQGQGGGGKVDNPLPTFAEFEAAEARAKERAQKEREARNDRQ